jgi:hypothetical protein
MIFMNQADGNKRLLCSVVPFLSIPHLGTTKKTILRI